MSYNVFISHAKKDADLASDLAQRLREAGQQVITVENLAPGEDWVTGANRALESSDEVIALLTDNSVASPWVMQEVGAAVSLRKHITPVVVGSPEVPKILKQYQYLKYSDLPRYISDLHLRAEKQRGQSKPSVESTAKGVRHARSTSR